MSSIQTEIVAKAHQCRGIMSRSLYRSMRDFRSVNDSSTPILRKPAFALERKPAM